MASRRRRRHARSKALRRILIEHRFSAAEGLLGVAALALGIWMLWPDGGDPTAEHRARWQQTLLMAQQSIGEGSEAGDGTLVAVAEASMAVSARRELVGGPGIVSVSLAEHRLAQIADMMPEIGPPTTRFPPPAPELAAVEAPMAVDPGGSEHGASESVAALAAAVPLRTPPEEIAGREWLRYAAMQPVEDGRPKIAIVIDDLGNNRANTAALNGLPGPLTLAFLPYASDLPAQTARARAAGHELLIHMPMEPVTDDWPGPDALLISIEQEDFRARLQKSFASFHGFVGINNHMGSRLTADRGSMRLVMDELRRRDLLFLDSKTTSFSVGIGAARDAGVPHAQRDVFLDNDPEYGAVLRQLRATEAVARRNGFAIAIGHPNDATIAALRRWLPELPGRGFALVPVSTIVALRTCQHEPLLAGCRPDDTDAMRANAEAVIQSES
ncbi:MAG TPA: divergent polysaccharide deacetylase family protein [Geminicoccaceae bacterium]